MNTTPTISRREQIRNEIVADLLDTASCSRHGLQLTESRLLESLDIQALMAARKHALTGQHAQAVRVMCEALEICAHTVADKYAARIEAAGLAVVRHQKVRIERAGQEWFVDVERGPGTWKNVSVHRSYDEALAQKADLLRAAGLQMGAR